MIAERRPTTTEPAPRTAAWIVIACAMAWLVAIPLGLGQALLGPPSGGDLTSHATSIGLLYLPGLGLFALGAALASKPCIDALPRWRPGTPVIGLLRCSERPARSPKAPTAKPEPHDPSPAPRHPPRTSIRAPANPSPAPSIVTLGPGRSPAYAAFGFTYRATLVGPSADGFVALPPSGRLVLGRDPGADIVVGLAEVSWHHLELDVTESGVTVTELGSSNGTRVLDPKSDFDTEPPDILTPNTPRPWAVGETLQLADPVALSLTLEALR